MADAYPLQTYSDSSEDPDKKNLLPIRERVGPRRADDWKLSRALPRRVRRALRRCSRMKYIPARPMTIFLTLLGATVFVTSLVYYLLWFFNPDKEPLPWRAYCSVPRPFNSPRKPHMPKPGSSIIYAPPFPPPNLDDLPPAGVFLGVFTIAKGLERRMLIRNTWASHVRSRNGAGFGDAGNGTSRTVVRFIMGKPAKAYEASVAMEMEKYHDIVVLPMTENMNSGKTHAYFTWAAEYAWVPPSDVQAVNTAPQYSYTNATATAPALVTHDPALAHSNQKRRSWVRPDFVLKCDDDTFVMLAELEARLRVELHSTSQNATAYWAQQTHTSTAVRNRDITLAKQDSDPLIYWGYHIKSQFMGGEIYGMSWALATWVATEDWVRRHTTGAEDKVTASWMEHHPYAQNIRWASERCWIYNHPKSGTVYSHGFLFPSEVTRVQHVLAPVLGSSAEALLKSPWTRTVLGNAPGPPAWAASSVQTFGVRYKPPVSNLTPQQAVEALVEGAQMSLLVEGGEITAEYAWKEREGRNQRYEGKRVGGTVAVHFAKTNAWFLETALAMLEGDEVTELESYKGDEERRVDKT